jgi:hypothetical protein
MKYEIIDDICYIRMNERINVKKQGDVEFAIRALIKMADDLSRHTNKSLSMHVAKHKENRFKYDNG